MSKIKEIVVRAVLPAIKEVGKLEMEDALSDIKAHNTPEIYKNTLQGLYSGFSLLKDATLKSASKVDDGLVDLVLEAVKDRANADGIVFS